MEDVLDDDTFSAAFGFAVLTARKTLDADAWDEAHDAAVQERLDLCLADGVHPVWADVARRCPVLAQMSGFPEAEPSEVAAADGALISRWPIFRAKTARNSSLLCSRLNPWWWTLPQSRPQHPRPPTEGAEKHQP